MAKSVEQCTGESPSEVRHSQVNVVQRDVAAEVPVALTYNGVAHVVMFMTPQAIEDFVVGFSLTEGIISSPEALLSLDIRDVAQGMLAAAEISKEDYKSVEGRRRNLPGQAGCGICGVVELEQALRPLSKIESVSMVSKEAIFKALVALRKTQRLNQRTGAVHGAAFVDADGRVVAVREDIGRHNALDKLIGHMALTGLQAEEGFVLLTSRCSVELVQKAVTVGIACLVTISAPTGLALQLAREAGLTLVCVARHDSILVYNDPNKRIT